MKLSIYPCLKIVFWSGFISADVNFLRTGYLVRTWYLSFFSSLWKERSRGWVVPSILDTPILGWSDPEITVTLHRSQKDPQGMDQTPGFWGAKMKEDSCYFSINACIEPSSALSSVYKSIEKHCVASTPTQQRVGQTSSGCHVKAAAPHGADLSQRWIRSGIVLLI